MVELFEFYFAKITLLCLRKKVVRHWFNSSNKLGRRCERNCFLSFISLIRYR